MIRAIISAISFYLFPILVGRAVIVLTNKKEKPRLLPTIEYFAIGSLVLFLFTFILYIFFSNIFTISSFVKTFPIILRALFILLIIINLSSVKSVYLTFKKHWRAVSWILIIGIVIFSLWRWNTTYPLPITWDFFHHQALVNQIKAGRLSFLPSQISDTFRFNGYSPLFHLLLAWPQLIFSPNILSFLWWLEFLHLLTTLSAVYLLAKTLLKTQTAAIVATIFSGLIFESYMIYTSLFLIPQTLAAVVFAFLIIKFLSSKTSFKESWFNFLFLLILHYIIGAVAALILLFISWVSTRRKKISNLLIFAILLLILALTRVSLPTTLDFLNRGEAGAFNYSIEEKIEFFKIFSGYILFCFFPLGIVSILLSKKASLKILLLATLILIALVALPFPYVFKFYVLAHYPVSLFAALGFLLLFNRLKIKILKILTLSILFLVMLILFVSSTGFIKNLLKHPVSNAAVSWQEVQAAEFLKKHFADKNVLLISDPATQHILEPLSGINTQGGAYSDRETREILDQINQLTSPPQIKEKLLQIQDKVVIKKPDILLFVMSGRYFRWQETTVEKKKDLSFNVWSPVDLSLKDLESTEILSENEIFQKIFRNKALVIMQTSSNL